MAPISGFDDVEILTRLGVALAIGLLIGLERGWQQRELPDGERVAGFRTFALVSVLGAATVVLEREPGWVLAAVALALGIVAGVGYYRSSRQQRELSATGTIALMLTFVLGAMAGSGARMGAASAAVVVTLLLGVKPELHSLLQRIEREELLGTVRLLLISVVMLPILPNQGFGPWQALNPYRIWWMVVLVASVSYVGYFANRIWGGARGSILTGLFGGLVSSTAVSLTLSRRAATNPRESDALAAGIVVASSIMFLRVLLIVAPVARVLVAPLASSLIAAAAVGVAASGVLWLRSRDKARARQHDIELRNPFDLWTAVQFGLLLAAITVGSRALSEAMGDRGLYLIAVVAGLADVDAIALSLAAMASEGKTTIETAALALLTAVAVNTAVKSGIALALGGPRLGLRVALAMSAALTAGGAVAWYF